MTGDWKLETSELLQPLYLFASFSLPPPLDLPLSPLESEYVKSLTSLSRATFSVFPS